MNETNKPGVFFQEIKVKGNQLADKVREIVEEGNARRVIIKKEGRNVLEFPLSVGVGGATAAILLAPTLAAIGAFAALVTDVQIVVEREKTDSDALITTSTEMPEETAESSDPSI